MNIEEIKSGLTNPNEFVKKIASIHDPAFDLEDYKVYETENHKVNSLIHRPNKVINIPDPTGAKDADGEVLIIQTTELVTRISLGFQKLITVIGTSFATGGGIDLKAKTKDAEKPLFERVKDVWSKAKLDFKNYDILETLYSEREVCEIWYTEKPKSAKSLEDIKLKCNIYKPSEGFELIPVFDLTKNMTAFCLKYTVKINEKEVDKMDVYTDEALYKMSLNEKDWVIEKTIALTYGKIPVIYYRVKNSIWEDVQQIIDRIEELMSNFGDTNDYNGSPILFAEGEIKGFSRKGETGKVIEGENDAKLSYVSNNSMPESIKLEIDTLKDLLHSLTLTPDLSFRTMVNLGNVSGVAMDRILTGAHLKAKKIQSGVYGEGIQRRLNFLVSAICNIDESLSAGININITPHFNLFRIADAQEKITNMLLANGNLPITDHLTSIVRAGLSDNPEESFELIKKQQETANQNLNTTANNVPLEV